LWAPEPRCRESRPFRRCSVRGSPRPSARRTFPASERGADPRSNVFVEQVLPGSVVRGLGPRRWPITARRLSTTRTRSASGLESPVGARRSGRIAPASWIVHRRSARLLPTTVTNTARQSPWRERPSCAAPCGVRPGVVNRCERLPMIACASCTSKRRSSSDGASTTTARSSNELCVWRSWGIPGRS
jgi:hypothetical protein